MDFDKIALKIDSAFHSLNNKLNPTYKRWRYGRGLEQSSGLAFWLFAITLLLGAGFGSYNETILVNNGLWAWMAFILGACQLYYTGTVQRRVFNFLATAGWLTIAIAAYVELGGINLISALALPYCLCSFYIYGFLLESD